MSTQDRTAVDIEEEAFLLGRKKVQDGRWHEAILEFGRAIEADPESVRARLGRAVARQRVGDHAEALVELKALLRTKPQSSQARYALAWSQQAIGDLDSALQSSNTALGMRPDFVDALYLRGYLLRALGRPGARDDFDRVLELEPSYREAALARAKMNVCEERWVDAENDFGLVIQHSGAGWSRHRAEALHWRGVARCELDRLGEAIVDLSEALTLRPKDAAGLTRRALAYQRAGQLDASAADFAAAKKLLSSRDHVVAHAHCEDVGSTR